MPNLRTSVGDLKEIFAPVDEIANSCEIRFTEEGLYIPAADRMNIAIADIFVKSDSFNEFESEGERVGLQLSKLTEVLGMAQEDDSSNLFLDDEHLLHFEVENKEFILGLVSLDSVPQQPGIPDYDYVTEFSLGASELEDSVKTTGVFSDKVVFEVEEDSQTVEMKASGDIDRTCVKLGRSDFEECDLTDLQNSFSQEYLSDIVSVIPSDTTVTISMTKNHTMELEYPIINGGGHVVFTLAPWNEGTT